MGQLLTGAEWHSQGQGGMNMKLPPSYISEWRDEVNPSLISDIVTLFEKGLLTRAEVRLILLDTFPKLKEAAVVRDSLREDD